MREALRDPLVLSAHSAGTRIVTYGLWVALLFFILVDFRKAKIKKGFRRLALILSAHGAGMRIVTYGPNGRLEALPQDSASLSRKAGESFSVGCGADFGHEKTSLHGQRGFSLLFRYPSGN